MAPVSRWLTRILWAAAPISAAACSVIVIRDASTAPASCTTGYDGTDPGMCAQGVNEAPLVPRGHVPILEDA
jgi:hypothetical protein